MTSVPVPPTMSGRWIAKTLPMVAVLVAFLAFEAWNHRRSGCLTDSFVIGVAQPLSGNLAALGQDMVNGALLAAEHLNAAGGIAVCGRRLKVTIHTEDDASLSARGVEAANRLIDRGVVAVIGHLNSGVSIAAAPVYAAANVPQLAISTKPEFTQLGLATTFRLVANDSLQAAAMGGFAAALPSARRFAIVDDGSAYGVSLASRAADHVIGTGREIALRRSLDDKVTEFKTLIEALKSARVDVLITTLSDYQVKPLAHAASNAGLRNLAIVGGDTVKTSLMDSFLPDGPVIYATSPILDVRAVGAGKAFASSFRKRFGSDPVYAAHYAYDAVHVLADAASRNRDLNRTELLARLRTFDGNCPATGSVRFASDGEQRFGSVAVYRMTAEGWELLTRGTNW